MKLTTLLSALAVLLGLAIGLALPTLTVDAADSGVSRGTNCISDLRGTAANDTDGEFPGGVNPYATTFTNPGTNPYGVTGVTSAGCASTTTVRTQPRPNG